MRPLIRRSLRRLWLAYALLAGAVATLAIAIPWSPAAPQVYGIDRTTGHIRAVAPLSEPVMPEAALLDLVRDCIGRGLRQISSDEDGARYHAAYCFDGPAWAEYLAAVRRIKDTVVTANGELMAQGTIGAPSVLEAGLIDGLYTWTIHVPVRIDYLVRRGSTLRQRPEESRVVVIVTRSADEPWAHRITRYLTNPTGPGVPKSRS